MTRNYQSPTKSDLNMIDVICLKGFPFKPFVGEGLKALMASADVMG